MKYWEKKPERVNRCSRRTSDFVLRTFSCLCLPVLLIAQTPLAFDVASIKPNTSGEARQGVRFYPPSDRVVVTNMTLRGLIRNAYQLQDDEVAGGPSWLDSDHFDIVAAGDGNHSPQDKWLMLRVLLLERFKLAVHKETRELPVYALVVAKSGTLGPKLQHVDPDCSPPRTPPPQGPPDRNRPNQCGALFAGPGTVSFRGVLMTDLARFGLASQVGRIVVDRTGLAGRFDLDLEFNQTTSLKASPEVADASGDSAPSIFTALQEQLGLKLQSEKGPVEVLVVDHAEHPVED
jgi:uncharacterized protein (TIGR03435 family)